MNNTFIEPKPDYKISEANLFPKDWPFVHFGNLITEFRGGAPLRPSDFTNSGVKVLPKGGVGRTGWLNIEDTDLQYCSVEYAKNHLRNQVDGTFTILVLRDLVPSGPSIGLMVQMNFHEIFVLAQGVYGFKVNSRAVPGYLIHLSNTQWYRQLANSIMVGSTQVHITNTAFKQAQIPLPPPDEQRAIATTLSNVDALIDSLEKLIAKKCAIKTAAMQQLLSGKIRLPGFTEEWEQRLFGEIFNYLSTATNSRADLSDNSGDTYYIHYGDIHTKYHGHLDFCRQRPPMILRSLCKNAAYLQNGDWVMADASEDFDGVGKSIEISGLQEGDKAIAGLHTFLLREKTPTFSPGFKGHLGKLKSLHQQFLRVATGMKVFGVSKTALKDLILRIPSPAEQTAIATVLSDMDAEIAALVSRRDKAKSIKQGMMQELLTGRTRLI